MKILVNDFGGYAFPAQLSTRLSQIGHCVVHAFCDSLETTPQGCAHNKTCRDELRFEPVKLNEPLQKYSFVKRWKQEREYGRKLSAVLRDFRPDCILSADTPLDAQQIIWHQAERMRVARTFWMQDVIGIATKRILAKKLFLPGRLIGSYYEALERKLVRQSEQVVVIAEAFKSLLQQWNVDPQRTSVIENWAPFEELQELSGENAWANARGLKGKTVLLYSGTLSMKHDPSLLFELARALESKNAVLFVRSQGMGADWLIAKLKETPLDSLKVEPYGSYEELALALAAADVLVAILEPGAAIYSVPSKVLTYMCAKRAILLAVPKENLAAQIVERERAGLVSAPESPLGLIDNALKLIEQPELRTSLAENAYSYARRAFNIESIAARFEEILSKSCQLTKPSDQSRR